VSSSTTRAIRLESWIPPSFAWTTEPEVFCIEVPINDSDLVEFVAMGVLDCSPSHSSKHKSAAISTAALIALTNGRKSLCGQLGEAVWDRARLKPRVSWVKAGTKVVAHCYGVFVLPGDKSLCVLVGRDPPASANRWISEALKATADTLLAEHQDTMAAIDEEEAREKESWDALCERDPRMKDFCWRPQARFPPSLTAELLLPLLPRAVTFQFPASAKPDTIVVSALAQIAASNLAPSRAGTYSGICCGPFGKRGTAVVTWVPHTGLPSYPEVRWAVQKGLPATLRNPRVDTTARPEPVALSDDKILVGFEPDATDLKNVFEDLTLDDSDFRSRVDDSKKASETEGFEAIAWFQPYHVWTEATWGIYFDARKLDDFALSLLDDFRARRVQGSQSLAALLAFSLTYAHELFHARVEAVQSWHELNSRQPRHLRYKKNVYDALRQTPEWLEEALANWSAWEWFGSQEAQALLATMSPDLERLEWVVEAALDLSPPGYRDWRLGRENVSWRTFTNQLSTGNPKGSSRRISLPLEGAVKGPLPFEFLQSDIPLRFVGKGNIADRLQSHPATFNVPGRRELERALRYFRYVLDPSGGKGGHQKWTGPDQRAFTLPTRDPVSRIVFTAFLQHIGIDKTTYVQQIRPSL